MFETNFTVSWNNAGFLNAFKNKLSPNNSRPDLENALALLYLFLKDDSNITHSAQVEINENTGFVFDENQQLVSFDLAWDSRSYQQASLAEDFLKYGFNPGEGAAVLGNVEDGVKIYYSNSALGPWTYLTSKPKYINSYSMPCGMSPDPCTTEQIYYKITSYNSSGNSVDFNTVPNVPSIPINDPMNISDFEYFNNISLSILPNPVNEILYINYEVPSPSSIKIELFNASAQKIDEIFEDKVLKGKHQINHKVGVYPSGNYILRIIFIHENGLIFVKNVILNIIK